MLRNVADYRTDIMLSPDKVAYAFRIADEIFSKLAMIVSKINESAIVSAWSKIEGERQKRHFYPGAT
jgi:hypothetical protein